MYILDKTLCEYRDPQFSQLISFYSPGKSDQYKLFYSGASDVFYCMQSIQSRGSMLVGKSSLAAGNVFTLTQYDPIFFMVSIFKHI